jgi:hypothetical protein
MKPPQADYASIGLFMAHIWEGPTLKDINEGSKETWQKDVDQVFE